MESIENRIKQAKQYVQRAGEAWDDFLSTPASEAGQQHYGDASSLLAAAIKVCETVRADMDRVAG